MSRSQPLTCRASGLAGALAIGLVAAAVGCTSAAKKQTSCSTGQISCETNDPCDPAGCTNGCCLPKADVGPADAGLVHGGWDAGLSDGGCNCIMPDAGPARGCVTDSDCHGATSICNTTTGTCVECLEAEDCPGASEVCQSGSCVTAANCADAGAAACTGSGAPFCDAFFEQCSECAQDSDCPIGQSCLEGLCLSYQACSDNGDCPAGGVCGTYVNGDTTQWIFACAGAEGTVQGGEPCLEDTDCVSGWCESYMPDDGWCVSACKQDSDCGPDGWCPPDGVDFDVLPGPDGKYGTADDVQETVSVCMPKACANDAECAGTGYNGVDRVCGITPGTRAAEYPPGAVTSWVQACILKVGSRAGGPCSNDGNCESYRCISGSCFDACAATSDCADDGGACAPLGLDAGYVDESGSAITSCTN